MLFFNNDCFCTVIWELEKVCMVLCLSVNQFCVLEDPGSSVQSAIEAYWVAFEPKLLHSAVVQIKWRRVI